MKANGSLKIALALGLACWGATSATAGPILSPTGGVINDGGPGFGSLADTFNHNGLLTDFTSGVTDFDAYLALNPLHSLIFAGNEWFGNSGTSTASVTYDLGAVTSIDRLALWNEDASGIGFLNLYWSTDGVSFNPLALGLLPTNNVINIDYPADVFAFGAVDARYVRFDMSECPQADEGGFPACAIGEVAFRTAEATVPEPGTLVLLGIGLAGLAVGRRRRQS